MVTHTQQGRRDAHKSDASEFSSSASFSNKRGRNSYAREEKFKPFFMYVCVCVWDSLFLSLGLRVCCDDFVSEKLCEHLPRAAMMMMMRHAWSLN